MFLFGHVGITLGVGIAVGQAVRFLHNRADGSNSQLSVNRPEPAARTVCPESTGRSELQSGAGRSPAFGKAGASSRPQPEKPAARSAMTLTEMLFLVLGSMLPDIIDKPVGQFLFPGTFGHNGRIFSHTLVFLLVCLGISVFFFLAHKKTWGLYLSLGILMHLVLDSMWESPQVLLWPLYGWNFPAYQEISWWEWLQAMFSGLQNSPATYIPEFSGLLILAVTLAALFRTRLIVLTARKKGRSLPR